MINLVNKRVALFSLLRCSDQGGGHFSRSQCTWDELGLPAATLQSFSFQFAIGISYQQNKFSEGLSLCVSAIMEWALCSFLWIYRDFNLLGMRRMGVLKNVLKHFQYKP